MSVFARRRLMHLAACAFAALPWLVVASIDDPALAAGPRHVRVMSFNIAVGGEACGQPLEQTAAVIRASGADVVGLQETVAPAKKPGGRDIDNGPRLARLLGWNFVKQPNGRAIVTRLEVVETIPTGSGARLRTDDGADILMFNAHLAPAPYQPYQLCGVPVDGAAAIHTEADAIAGAPARSRGAQVDALLADVRHYRRAGEPVFITGDFNEPSHQDWTSAAAAAGHCPLAVSFPSTRALSDAGFVDAYRSAHPDPVRAPGRTWTTTTRLDDPHDRHDRIDFVFVDAGARWAGRSVVQSAHVVGESNANADVAVNPWPSDHRAVVATVLIP